MGVEDAATGKREGVLSEAGPPRVRARLERRGDTTPPRAYSLFSFTHVPDRRFRVEFQWFLTALSVRPGSNRAITAHRLPCAACAATTAASSQSENAALRTPGSSWLHHRRRQDLPDRPLMPAAILDQLRGP